jgi:acyl carrier protein
VTSLEGAGKANDASAAERKFTRQELRDQLIEIIRSELPDKTVVLTMETRGDAVDIDSLAIIQTVFKVEEHFGITVPVATDTPFETVGDLVNKLIECFPPARLAD